MRCRGACWRSWFWERRGGRERERERGRKGEGERRKVSEDVSEEGGRDRIWKTNKGLAEGCLQFGSRILREDSCRASNEKGGRRREGELKLDLNPPRLRSRSQSVRTALPQLLCTLSSIANT